MKGRRAANRKLEKWKRNFPKIRKLRQNQTPKIRKKEIPRPKIRQVTNNILVKDAEELEKSTEFHSKRTKEGY